MNNKPKPHIFIAIFLWATAMCVGFISISAYKGSVGTASAPPLIAPLTLASTDHPVGSLYMFVHPQCSCSTASLNELARLLSDSISKPQVHILFADTFGPQQAAAIQQSGLWKMAIGIPGATVAIDHHKQLAQTLRVSTSGDVIFYNHNGKLLFHGGITPSRGHEGDSFGRLRLLAVINGQTADSNESSVYGCTLDQPPGTGNRIKS